MKRYKETSGKPSKFGIDIMVLRKWRHGFAVKLCNILNVPQQKLDGTDHC